MTSSKLVEKFKLSFLSIIEGKAKKENKRKNFCFLFHRFSPRPPPTHCLHQLPVDQRPEKPVEIRNWSRETEKEGNGRERERKEGSLLLDWKKQKQLSEARFYWNFLWQRLVQICTCLVYMQSFANEGDKFRSCGIMFFFFPFSSSKSGFFPLSF